MARKSAAKRAATRSRPTSVAAPAGPRRIASLVQFVRREKVLLDADLAELYGVSTSALNQAVKRNSARFPQDFMFQLSAREWNDLKRQAALSESEGAENQGDRDLVSQSVISGYGGRRTPPYAFTEQGVAMLSSVLQSSQAIEVNIAIMRTFVQLRGLMTENKLLAQRMERLEKKYDGQFREVFHVIGKILRNEIPDA